jgi:hypothetical protein
LAMPVFVAVVAREVARLDNTISGWRHIGAHSSAILTPTQIESKDAYIHVTHRKSKISFVRHFHHWHSNWISNVFWSNEWALHGSLTELTEQELPWLCQSQKMDALNIK